MLLHPWDFLGKDTGVGCHYLLQPALLPAPQSSEAPHLEPVKKGGHSVFGSKLDTQNITRTKEAI